MKLVSFRTDDGSEHIGVLEADTVFELAGVSRIDATTDVEALLAAPRSGEGRRLADVQLLPPTRPEKILCVGLNYNEHIEETGRELPTYPVLFAKFASNLIGAGADIQLPPESDQMDYEAELVIVIGKEGRRIAKEDALHHVLGYTIANDVTMRDYQYKTHQWIQGKAWDGSTPVGPAIVTADEVDAGALDIELSLNGEVMQHSNTKVLIFDVATLVSEISTFTRLSPGDLILTGTPGGVGFRREPKVRLEDGDVVEVTVGGLGVLRNTVRREKVD